MMIKPRSSKINWTKVLAVFKTIVLFLVLGILFKLLTIEPIPENKPLPPLRPEPSPSGSVEYPDVSIFYEHEAHVCRCNARSGKIQEIAYGYYPTLSPDRKTLAYVC